MTDPLFFDTDCISAFLWADNESILAKLYPKRIIIPKQVYDELSHPGLNHIKGLKIQVDKLVQSGMARIESIDVGSQEYELFSELTGLSKSVNKIIGDGEAAAISMAKYNDGILASNNLKDVMIYVEKYELIHMTTGDIMKEALNAGLINEAQGNVIWKEMLARRRKLGYGSFTEFLENH